MTQLKFPKEFAWGVATSAQQIEGATEEGGRGESIWDRFAATPGNIAGGSSTAVACDHYNRWREDVRLMQWLGVGAYRFSIAWSRVLPAGRGAVNSAGLDFYDKLVDALLEANLEPYATLYHWDLPQALQEGGGWAERDTAEAFAEYAAVVSEKLGDRVARWVTHNEPWCIATLGHERGVHAPGHRDPAEALRVGHHVLLSHGWATSVLRQNSPKAEVGIAVNLSPVFPASASHADLEAARQLDGLFNRWYLDPLMLGSYPQDAIEDRVRWGHLGTPDLPFVQAGDLPVIAAPLDFLGVNYYTRAVVKAGDDGRPDAVAVAGDDERTDMGWEVYPQGLYEILVRVHRDYAPSKMYITENGAAYGDAPNAARRVADARRVEYLRGHLMAVHRAITEGVPVHGYFAWSLLDNFEWADGYDKRFGLFWVDYATQERLPKDSAFWFRDVVAAGTLKNGAQPGRRRRKLDGRRLR